MNIGVIFDMDGVIMDNNAYHQLAWEEFCKGYDVKLSEDEFHNHVFGRIAKETLEYIFKREIGPEETEKFVEQKEKIYRQIYSKQIKPLGGLIDFITRLKQNGIKMALATSAPPGNVEFTFEHLEIKSYFEFVLDGNSVSKGKPDPEIYIKAINRLGFNPAECFIFEDSLPGIQSAIASGAMVIGVATTHKPDEIKGVKFVIKDFTRISIRDLQKIAMQESLPGKYSG